MEDGFPELPLLYPETDIHSFMVSSSASSPAPPESHTRHIKHHKAPDGSKPQKHFRVPVRCRVLWQEILWFVQSSGGLLVSSLDKDMFDAEPMRELSHHRPLVHTEFQGQRVILKVPDIYIFVKWSHSSVETNKGLVKLYFCTRHPSSHMLL